MTTEEARELLAPAVDPIYQSWADIGAGTGTFVEALQQMLPSGSIYALDKSPHLLWTLAPSEQVPMEIVEGDFTQEMELPQVDAILMANALHYARDHAAVLRNVLQHLRPGGRLVLIEYDTDQGRPPWVPHPLSLQTFHALANELGLQEVTERNRRRSIFGDDLYLVMASWPGPDDQS